MRLRGRVQIVGLLAALGRKWGSRRGINMNFSVEALEAGSDVLLVRPTKFVDRRGYFMETWSKAAFAEIGIPTDFVQDNESLSAMRGTVRGLHYQRAPAEQAKLVRVLRGAIFDVVVDIRPASRTFGKWLGVTLSSDEGNHLYVPGGYAHGFVTLTNETVVTYKVDAPYSRECEGGIRWNDPELGIRWPSTGNEVILSERDAILPLFRENVVDHE